MCVRERENKAIATFSLSTYLVFPSVSDQKISKVSQVTVFVNDSNSFSSCTAAKHLQNMRVLLQALHQGTLRQQCSSLRFSGCFCEIISSGNRENKVEGEENNSPFRSFTTHNIGCL